MGPGMMGLGRWRGGGWWVRRLLFGRAEGGWFWVLWEIVDGELEGFWVGRRRHGKNKI